ncbi:MAG: N-6 DNA methylase [Rhodococcus sp. (in: high G+C Gram-positive bacteria)]|uniref:KfrB domain-containing protein n=1 Tax=Rhodococcus sp. TaxID=1831 RepID=UPI002AD972A2|nr:N-6 DNA methylase [Rhodococcus sp. (in: high G+C Gram-positive bacteria)]
MGAGGARTKFRDNVAAIRLLRQLGTAGRAATPEEQSKLVRYVGWGGLPQAFDPSNPGWQTEYQELHSLLSASELAAARRSTQDAHFTPTHIVEAIYAALERFGFRGGEILEPAMGTGHFAGLMPEGLREQAHVTGIELDPITAEIAKHLYPSAKLINKAFQEVVIPAEHYDAVVGNPPFGSQSVYDPEHRELSKLSIHNYFLAKSLDKLREGGLMAVVVSSYFLDGADPTAREWMSQRATLLGAVRLPNNAFKQNAQAEVTTDVIFLRKGAPEITDMPWTDLAALRDPLVEGDFEINRYFVEHPEMLLGSMRLHRTQFGTDAPACIAPDGQNLVAALATAIARLPKESYRPRRLAVANDAPKDGPLEIPQDVKVGAFFVAEGGRLARRLPDVLDHPMGEWAHPASPKAAERIRSMVELRSTLRALMLAERNTLGEEDLVDGMRRRLNAVYDDYVRKHGYISALANRQVLQDDPDYPLLHSLERNYDKGISREVAQRHGVAPREPSADKADIFTKRVMKPIRDITQVDSAKDALVISMNESGRVSMPMITRLTGKSEEAVIKELAHLVFFDPATRQWETADKYLAGNVKAKLTRARAEAERDRSLARSVTALERVQPPDIDAVDIGIQLGATWVPAEVVSEFVGHLLGAVESSISYQAATGTWQVKVRGGDHTTLRTTWGTPEASADKLLEAILGLKPIQVKEQVGRNEFGPIMKVNEDKTAAANQKADEIRQAFLDWVWNDSARRERLAKIYNDTFNTNVVPRYDGSHLVLPGASTAIELRAHQKDAIWRGIQDGSTLFDHVVGAGKTYVKIAVAMESRRMGLLKKPMFAVPNHLLLQWKDSFYALYPAAKVLVAEKTDFTKEHRERLFAKIATGDWDAVVVGHSSLKKIGMPPETLDDILTEQVRDLTSAIRELKSSRGDRVTIKEMEKAKERMEAKLERMAAAVTKDRAVTFDELGVDALFIDEGHEFKNLFITTSLSRISGLGNLAGSDKAFDLFVKCRYLQQTYQGRGVYIATGTPISNTIAELFTVQRYMRYDDLRARGIHHFDAWASAFGQVVAGWELDATGVNYKLNSRFAKFQNVPELVAMYRTFADVVTRQDLDAQAAARGGRFPVPRVKGGKPTNVIVNRSMDQAQYMGVQSPMLDASGKPCTKDDGTAILTWNKGSIIYRMEHLPKDPSDDNPLKITNDARKAGLDFRLIDPAATDFAGSKINALIVEAMRIYREWDDRKGTQLIFCDLSTPKGKATSTTITQPSDGNDRDDDAAEAKVSMDELLAGASSFSVYEDIKAKLIAHGVPDAEVRFIHDAATDLQKSKLFDEVNRGHVRFLLGSTAKMGAGTNVQRRLVAEHNLDCPWRPSDLEQRDGRIIRQGNMFYEADPDGFEVEMFRYATKQTYDSRMWQTVECKASGIEQFRRGDTQQRVIEDIAGEAANAAEMKAAATGNPLIFMQVRLAAELKKLEAVHANFRRAQHLLDKRVAMLGTADKRTARAVERAQAEIARREPSAGAQWCFQVGRQRYNNDSKDALLHIVLTSAKAALDEQTKTRQSGPTLVPVGKYRGFEVGVFADGGELQFVLKGEREYSPGRLAYRKGDDLSIGGFIQRLDNALSEFEREIAAAEAGHRAEVAELAKAREELAKPFVLQAKLELLRRDVADVLVELKKRQANPDYTSTWTPATDGPAPTRVDQAGDLARAQGFSPQIVNTDAGVYTGGIIAATNEFIVQDIGMKAAAIHKRADLDGAAGLQEGEPLRIAYKGGKGVVQAGRVSRANERD